MRTIKAVLFDYGMVLSGPPVEAALRRIEALLDADGGCVHAAYWRFRDAYDRGALTGRTYWQAVAADLKRPLSEATLAELIDADTAVWTEPNEPMIAWAAKLQAAGMKTGILSNLGDAMENGITARFGWMEAFTHRTFSHRLGVAKPDPAIYKSAAEGLGVDATEILFIDDREENIAAGRAAGMMAIRYLNHESFLATMKSANYGLLL